MSERLTFSNPRLRAEFTDWPSGSKRVSCVFQVHAEGRKGERVSRTTTGKPKFTTYGKKMRIVDGSNGKTYLLQYTEDYGKSIRVVMSDLLHDASGDMGTISAYIREEDPDFPALFAMVATAK